MSWRHPLPDDLLAHRPRPRFLAMLRASRRDNLADVEARRQEEVAREALRVRGHVDRIERKDAT